MSESNRIARVKVRRNESGSIEGLPLQLMIMGIIASLGTAVIVGWISSIQTPIYVGQVGIDPEEIFVQDANDDGIYDATLKELKITVTDTGANPIENAKILLEGPSLDNEHHRLFGTTGADGSLVLHDVSVKLIGDRTAVIKVSISGQEIASEYWTEIMVLPE